MRKGKKRFRPGEAIIPGISLIFGIWYFIQTRDASLTAIKWPYIIAALSGILWLGVVFFFVFTSRETVSVEPLQKNGMSKIILIFLAPVIYIWIMPYIGFGIASFLFLMILFRLLGGRSWIRNGGAALSITLFLYVSMILLMKMSLPRLIIGPFQI